MPTRSFSRRSVSSNQPPTNEVITGDFYDEDDRSLVYSSYNGGGDPSSSSHHIILLRRSEVGEQFRLRLKEKLVRNYGDFLVITNLSQNESGQVEFLECQVKLENPLLLQISCSLDNKFHVKSKTGQVDREEKIAVWLDRVCKYGLSSQCKSLTSLFQFMYKISGNSATAIQSPTGKETEAESLAGMVDQAKILIEESQYQATVDLLTSGLREILVFPQITATDETIQQSLILRGTAWYYLGNYTQSLADFDNALSGIDAISSHALFFKGMCLEKLERYREALDCYLVVLESEPGHAGAQDRFTTIFDRLAVIPENPNSATRRRSDSADSDANSSGTTASRWSSRSTMLSSSDEAT
jgi:tetratricopeptide (TPR) repeat protein